ncbi:hypothetical protein AXF42_Ash003175 [Apostasia shenzhenica]|uniref:EamA domain-containing protein n=1 Tax=Apostasia shenzhenica TaxID=1088818 RepID=A0A2I0BFE5_9ASPA|nr:hypothetical protein AXF42_Ash003175 [Apostasia shenzhenica]
MGCPWKLFHLSINRDSWRWALGLAYIVAVAVIWIAASYVVQSVVDAGVSPFLVTYICNSLFLVYIPVVEIGRFFENSMKISCPCLVDNVDQDLQEVKHNSESFPILLQSEEDRLSENISTTESGNHEFSFDNGVPNRERLIFYDEDSRQEVDEGGRWTRRRVAKISLFICPFWFLGQLTFNLSLKYTTVTSNTILSSASSLFTFLVSLTFLGEKFTWIKLISVLLCMGGTIMVSLADSSTNSNSVATNPLVGDILALVSACLYAVYITLIRAKLPDEDNGKDQASTPQFLGYLGLFNFLIFLPVALVLDFTRLEPFHVLTWKQFGLIVGKVSAHKAVIICVAIDAFIKYYVTRDV